MFLYYLMTSFLTSIYNHIFSFTLFLLLKYSNLAFTLDIKPWLGRKSNISDGFHNLYLYFWKAKTENKVMTNNLIFDFLIKLQEFEFVITVSGS